MAWLSTIPPSVMFLINGVILALLGVYFSRKQTGANVADKITAAAARNIDEYEKRIARLEKDVALSKQAAKLSDQRERQLAARVSSLEHNDRENQTWIKSLETQYAILKKEHNELKFKYAKLRTMYDARLKGGQGEQNET